MICNNCLNKDICKIYSFVKENSYIANIIINDCSKSTNKTYNATNYNAMATDNRKSLTREIISIERDVDKVDKLSKENDKLKTEEKKKQEGSKPKPKILINEIKAKDEITCITCNGGTFKEDIRKCCICGKDTCSNCCTFNADDGQVYCNDCWLVFE